VSVLGTSLRGVAEQRFPWQAGTATGVGSMPGTDPVEACRVVFGELPDLPYLPELPGRGPGADITGRTAALLVDLPAQVTSAGWKLTDRPGRDLTRAAGYWSQDLDTLEETAGGYTGPVKIQVCGPWTLAATLELSHSANPALSDPGAVADLAASLAEGLAGLAADVRKRVPGGTLLVQLDEPSLPVVLAGRVPTASGLATVAAIDRAVASQRLATVLAAPSAPTVVHCCGRVAAAFGEIVAAGATAVSFDLDQIPVRETDRVAELAEAGLGLLAGALPTASAARLDASLPTPAPHRFEEADAPPTAPRRVARPPTGPRGARGADPPPTPRQTADRVVAMWRRTGLPPSLLAGQVVITPACGLAAVSPAAATAALRHCREAARVAAEMIEEQSP
jgi:methionine synthase II (cobalamin-independent)